MGKKNRQSKSDGPVASTSAAAAQPLISANALTKLTERIQKDSTSSKHGPEKSARRLNKEDHSAGKLKGKDAPGMGKEVLQSENHKDRTERPKERAPHTTVDASARGKKRPRESLGYRSRTQTGNNPKAAVNQQPVRKSKPNKSSKKKMSDEDLLKEIKELGGTKDDLELVKDIESGSDEDEVVESGGNKDTKIRKNDVMGFMKQIGLEAGTMADAEEEEDEEEEEEEEEEEDEDEEEGDQEEAAHDQEQDEVKDEAEDMESEFDKAQDKSPRGKGKLIFDPRPDWHAFELPLLSLSSEAPPAARIAKLKERGTTLLKAENLLYSTSYLSKSSDRQFLSNIMNSGTLSDKTSALTLICQESPLHTTKTLESLLSLTRKKSKNQSTSALNAIKDLFGAGSVLPERKLKYFGSQPGLGSKDIKDIHLLVWTYEDWLKTFYFEVVKTLTVLAGDQLVFARTHAVRFMYELLKSKPEQEQLLLQHLVNKIGDPDNKVASTVSHFLLKLQQTHPGMNIIVIGYLESEVLFRPGNSTNAKYYAIVTLNQTILSRNDHDTANKLLDIYFSLFTSLLTKCESQPSREKTKTEAAKHTKFEDQETAFKKMNKKALARKKQDEERTQYEEETSAKLISAILVGVNRAFPFSKIDDAVFQKHMDTLFKITHSGNFKTSIQALNLILQVTSSKQSVSDRFYRTLYESLMDQRLITSSQQAQYLNILFKALKLDTNMKRIKAFVKRILQICILHQPAFICASLFLLSQLEAQHPHLHTILTTPEDHEDDDEEVFRDVPDEDDDVPARLRKLPPTEKPSIDYDGHKRDPLFANADRSCLWELTPFLNHFHPTVSIYASALLTGKSMPSKPDLGMHTLSAFLDRFVYRNPKAAPTATHGSSIMQPLAGATAQGMVLSTRDKKALVPVNSEQWWKRKLEDVRVDEVFFHRYFNIQAAGKRQKESRRKAKARGSDSEDESEQEQEIWNALVDSRPELEGDDGDIDFDHDDFSGLEDDVEMVDDPASDAGWESDGESADGADDMEVLFTQDIANAGRNRRAKLEAYQGPDSSDEDEEGVPLGLQEEEEEEEEDGDHARKKKRRKMKGLPTFASVDDYAHLLDQE